MWAGIRDEAERLGELAAPLRPLGGVGRRHRRRPVVQGRRPRPANCRRRRERPLPLDRRAAPEAAPELGLAVSARRAAAASSETRVSVWKRSSANGAIRSGVRPSRRARRASSPTIGAALKPYVPQPRRDVEALELGYAEDRAVVGREVAETRPRAEHVEPLELREELERVPAEYSRNGNVPIRLVGRVRLDLGADQELAAVGLRDVDVHLRRDDDRVEERLHRLGDERLQDVRRDREPDARQAADERRPAGASR